ncbi:MAG TPA: HAD-IA family hydrolase [Anaerolineales bacterium]|nr:HAD-IA family hydrolase [Anaerolineales bacterium]
MYPKIIFDLSEVLIPGLIGVEKSLSALVHLPENEILKCFEGNLLQEICRGEITEDAYLQGILALQRWDIPAEILKKNIRENFHPEVEGTRSILLHLAKKYEVVLLSDHAREWITYIKSVHPFLSEFKQTFFSYELGKTKKDPKTFEEVLEKMSCKASECWLIDDSAENIAIAASVGVNGIQFRNARQLQEQLVSQSLW